MCFGVRDAIALALEAAGHQPLTVLGDLVHNETVMAGLRARGILVAREAAEAPTRRVMITAHGASQRAIQRAGARGLEVFDATCPLVHLAHRAVKALAAAGYHPVIIGKRDHVEVRGLTEDLAEFDVVLDEEDILALEERERFWVAAQTTQPIERARRLVEFLRRRFPNADVRFADTVCQPTKQRQDAAVDLARQSDVVVVIGGAHSNNTRELAGTCARFCGCVHQVSAVEELRPEWFGQARTVGLTAGTSTPDRMVDEVERWLRNLDAEGSVPTERSADARLKAA